jgi:predicted Zn-dependent protease
MRSKLLEGLEDNYIYNAAMGNDILRWNIKSFPLKVCFENKEEVPDYYYKNINKAFSLWTSRTNFVKFEEVSNSSQADIIVKFKKYTSDDCSSGSCKYVIAYTEPKIIKDKVLSNMVLTFYKTNPLNKNFSSQEIFNAALHEIGHTLGIMGHSDNSNHVMYAEQNGDFPLVKGLHGLNNADLNTLVLLYRLEPTISNTKIVQNENFYYPPLILGNDNVRLMKKLKELQKYIKEYPMMAAGYINISSVYADLAKFDEALAQLDKAQSLTTTSDEKYLIQYDRAIIYFNQQDYDKSLKYANLAKEIRNDDNVESLIEDIQKITVK